MTSFTTYAKKAMPDVILGRAWRDASPTRRSWIRTALRLGTFPPATISTSLHPRLPNCFRLRLDRRGAFRLRLDLSSPQQNDSSEILPPVSTCTPTNRYFLRRLYVSQVLPAGARLLRWLQGINHDCCSSFNAEIEERRCVRPAAQSRNHLFEAVTDLSMTFYPAQDQDLMSPGVVGLESYVAL